MGQLSHLDELEAEAIYIIREVAAECEKPVMLYSIGKDSSVMLHLAMKAFYPEKPPFPFLHVNTTWHSTNTDLPQHLVVAEETRKNQERKSVSSPLEMSITHGTRRTRDRRCGSFTIPRSKRKRKSGYSRSRTGQRKTSGSISSVRTLRFHHCILQR